MGTKIDNVKRWFGVEPGGKWKVSSKESKRDQTKLHWSDKSPKYRVRYIGVHNPAKGVVYRKVRVKRSTFQDPKWRKKNPHMYSVFSAPQTTKPPPLNVYNPIKKKNIDFHMRVNKKYNWE